MAEHKADIHWTRTRHDDNNLLDFNREHTWTFDNGLCVEAASAPEFKGSPDCVDPEESFTASVASCHMLSFLWIAVNDGFCPTLYEDHAIGHLEKNEEGYQAITKVDLYPKVKYHENFMPDKEQEKEIHHKAHRFCFIANSIKSEVVTHLE